MRAHLDVLLESFGPGRLVWGSDWPVSLLSADTAAWMTGWHAVLDPVATSLDATARRVYRLPPS